MASDWILRTMPRGRKTRPRGGKRESKVRVGEHKAFYIIFCFLPSKESPGVCIQISPRGHSQTSERRSGEESKSRRRE